MDPSDVFSYMCKDDRNIKTIKVYEKNSNINEDDLYGLASLTIALLKDEQRARDLRLGGNKVYIVTRIINYINNVESGGEEEDDIEVNRI